MIIPPFIEMIYIMDGIAYSIDFLMHIITHVSVHPPYKILVSEKMGIVEQTG
jgi:hypothetical protein